MSEVGKHGALIDREAFGHLVSTRVDRFKLPAKFAWIGHNAGSDGEVLYR